MRLKTIFYILVVGVFFASMGITHAINTIPTGYKTTLSDVQIDAHGTCHNIKHVNSIPHFIPTKTSKEWSVFRNNIPSKVNLSNCQQESSCKKYVSLGSFLPAGSTDWVFASSYDEGSNTIYYVLYNNRKRLMKVKLGGSISPQTALTLSHDIGSINIVNSHLFMGTNSALRSYRINSSSSLTYLGSSSASHSVIGYWNGYYFGRIFTGTLVTDPTPIRAFRLNGGVLQNVARTNDSSIDFLGGAVSNGQHVFTIDNNGVLKAFRFNGTNFSLAASYSGSGISVGKYVTKYKDYLLIDVYNTQDSNANIMLYSFHGNSFSKLTKGYRGGTSGSLGIANDHGMNITGNNIGQGYFNSATVQYYNESTNKFDISYSSNNTNIGDPSIYGMYVQNRDPLTKMQGNKIYELRDRLCPTQSSCTLPAKWGGGKIPHGFSIPAYSDYKGVCHEISQLRSCNNGNLLGSYTYSKCGYVETSVICTHYNKKGLLSDELYSSETKYGQIVDPGVYKGYLFWATPFVAWLEKNEWADVIVAPMVNAWAEEVAFVLDERDEGNKFGRIMMFIGEPISKWLSIFADAKE